MTPEEHKQKLRKKWTPFVWSIVMTLFFMGLVLYHNLKGNPIDSTIYFIALACAVATIIYAYDYYKFKNSVPMTPMELLNIVNVGGMETFPRSKKVLKALKAEEDFPEDLGDRLDRLMDSLGNRDRNGVEQCALGLARAVPNELKPRRAAINVLAYVYCVYTTDDVPVQKAREACLKAIRSMGGEAVRNLVEDLTSIIPTLPSRVASPGRSPNQVRTVWSARVELLGEIGGKEAVKPLLELVNHPRVKDMDRDAAMGALEKIGGEEALAGLEAARLAPPPQPAPARK